MKSSVQRNSSFLFTSVTALLAVSAVVSIVELITAGKDYVPVVQQGDARVFSNYSCVGFGGVRIAVGLIVATLFFIFRARFGRKLLVAPLMWVVFV